MSQFPGDIGSVYMRRRHDPFAQYDPRRDMTPRVNADRSMSLADRLRMGANQGRTHRGGREINRPGRYLPSRQEEYLQRLNFGEADRMRRARPPAGRDRKSVV